MFGAHAQDCSDGSGHTHNVDVDMSMVLDKLIDGQALINITTRRGDGDIHLLVRVSVKVGLDILGTCTVGARPPVVAGSDGTAYHHSVFHALIFFDAKIIWQLPTEKYVNQAINGAFRVLPH